MDEMSIDFGLADVTAPVDGVVEFSDITDVAAKHPAVQALRQGGGGKKIPKRDHSTMMSIDTTTWMEEGISAKRPRRSPKKKPVQPVPRRASVPAIRQPKFRKEEADVESEDLPAFVAKLFQIAVTEQSPHLCWNEEGTSFRVLDQEMFSEETLANYYASNNFGSFVRQLNLYGFRKTRKDKHILEFAHPCFQRDQPDLLYDIIRRAAGTSRISAEASHADSPASRSVPQSPPPMAVHKLPAKHVSKPPAVDVGSGQAPAGASKEAKEMTKLKKEVKGLTDTVLRLNDAFFELRGRMEMLEQQLAYRDQPGTGLAGHHRSRSDSQATAGSIDAASGAFDLSVELGSFMTSPFIPSKHRKDDLGMLERMDREFLLPVPAATHAIANREPHVWRCSDQQLVEMGLSKCKVLETDLENMTLSMNVTTAGIRLWEERSCPSVALELLWFAMKEWPNGAETGTKMTLTCSFKSGFFECSLFLKPQPWRIILTETGEQQVVVTGWPGFDIARPLIASPPEHPCMCARHNSSSALHLVLPQVQLCAMPQPAMTM